MVSIKFVCVDGVATYTNTVGNVTEVVELFKSKFGDVKILDIEETK